MIGRAWKVAAGVLIAIFLAALFLTHRRRSGDATQTGVDVPTVIGSGSGKPSSATNGKPLNLPVAPLRDAELDSAVKRLRERERADAVVLETMPYPKTEVFAVAVPCLVGELRDKATDLVNRLPDGSAKRGELMGFLDFLPSHPESIGNIAPSGACAWRIILLNIYTEENRYRFQVVDTNGQPEEALAHLPSGLLTIATGVNTRAEDISIEDAKKRYSHLFSIEDDPKSGAAPIQPLLDYLRK